jgi:hypothetical protein
MQNSSPKKMKSAQVSQKPTPQGKVVEKPASVVKGSSKPTPVKMESKPASVVKSTPKKDSESIDLKTLKAMNI